MLYQNCEPVRNALNAVGAVLGGALSTAVGYIRGGIEWLIKTFSQLWNTITNNPILALLGGPITAIVYLMNHWDEVTKALGNAWSAFCGGVQWLYDRTLKPVFDAIGWVYNNVLKPIGDFLGGVGSALNSAGNAISNALGLNKTTTTSSSVKKLAGGGIVTEPTFALVGEAGPEAVIPLGSDSSSFGPTVYDIRPTVNIYGNIGNGVTLTQVMDMVNQGVGDAVSKFEAERIRRKSR
jgi:hypothetical protein